MNYKIYTIAENKIDKFYIEAIKEYEKRLSKYCKIKLHHIKNREQLLSKLSKNSHVILISTEGANISSEELAEKINSYGVTGISNITIILGDSLEMFKDNFDESIMISTMDMEIGLQATILFEQIYRAYRIINNQPYHK